MYIRAYTCIYIHLRAYTYWYMHIRTYTFIYVHFQPPPNRCRKVFWRVSCRRFLAAVWNLANQICCDGPWDWITMLRYGTGDCPAWSGGVQKGHWTRAEGGGCAKSGVQKCRLRRKKMHAQMPWGALSGARWLPSMGNVFWGGGINSRVSGGHSRKYMHIRAIYMHIRHIHTYTCIYLHIRSAFVCVHISVSCWNIRAYTCIYVHIRALKPYWILKFLHVCAYVFARICTYLRTYLQVYASMCNYTYIDAPNNFPYKKYVHIRAIRANTCKYGTIYVHHTCIYVLHFCENTCNIRQIVCARIASMCKYMHVYCTYTCTYVKCTYMQVWASMCMYAKSF